jgi:hypothetical protein
MNLKLPAICFLFSKNLIHKKVRKKLTFRLTSSGLYPLDLRSITLSIIHFPNYTFLPVLIFGHAIVYLLPLSFCNSSSMVSQLFLYE